MDREEGKSDCVNCYMALELSRSKWLVGALLPDSKKVVVNSVPGGDVEKLLRVLSQIEAKAVARMLTRQEAAARLNVHEHTVARWAKHGLITSHAYNGHYCLYEIPDANLPQKHCSRWDRLTDRAAARAQIANQPKPSPASEGGAV